jgi:hypothetical protein
LFRDGAALACCRGCQLRWTDGSVGEQYQREQAGTLVFNRGGGTLAPAQQIDLSPNLTGPAQALMVRDVNFDGTADLLVGSNQAPAYLLIANISP